MIPRESDFTRKQEISSTSDGTAKISKTASSINSSNPTSSWSRLKDPRVVRVSRAFGGKDRHSKVCTVRGLRDRRVRLSVPTAIQLYDLQERLGLNQPSKVVDWLLDAAKHEIDELPPLQIPPGAFTSQINNLHQPLLLTSCDHDDELMRDKQGGLNINDDNINWCNDETLKETSNDHHHHREEEEENNWARSNDEVRQFSTNSLQETNNNQSNAAAFLSASRQSPYSSSSSLLNNQFVRWDPNPNLTLSHNYPPRSHTDQQTAENLHNFSFVPTMSALPSGSHHQVFLYQPAGLLSTQSYFPFQIPAALDRSEIDQKHVPYSNPP